MFEILNFAKNSSLCLVVEMEPFTFSLKSASSCRLGSLVFHELLPFSTPGCMLYAQAGSVPHLTFDNVERVVNRPWPLVMPLQSVYDTLKSVEAFAKPLGEFCGFPATYPVIIPLHEALQETPRGNNDALGVAIWKPAGKVKLISEHFMELIAAFRPSAYQALTDGDTATNCSKKRRNHAVKRSLDYLNECLEIHKGRNMKSGVLASIQGGFDAESRMHSVGGTLEGGDGVSGYIIDGFHYNGEAAANISYTDIAIVLKATLEKLPENKPRFMFGCFTPDLALKLAEAGVDCFDSSYACLCSEQGRALNFSYQDVKLASEEPRFLQLDHETYRDDMQVISDKCQCYTCQNKFARAYINHLLLTRELLAQILLQLHNLHHYLKFFESMRENFGK